MTERLSDLEALIALAVLAIASEGDALGKIILEELVEMDRQDVIDRAHAVLDDDEDDSIPPPGVPT
jgi:hypothetical protein